ncbi:MAG: hypothetical protein GY754_22335 [bacterium]|nr:hypothetical protein [bacterium]
MDTVESIDTIRWIDRGDLKFRIKKINDEQSIVWTTKLGFDVNFTIMIYEFFEYCSNEFSIDIRGDNSWSLKGFIIRNDDIALVLGQIGYYVDEWNIEPDEEDERISEEEWYSVWL